MTNKMILRLTCSRIFTFLWLLLIKGKICHVLDNPQRYPSGITATEAQAKCGTFGLVNDPLILTKMYQLYGREFWTGQGIFTQSSPWIEIIGCFFLRNQPTTVFKRSSPGSCEQECSTEYFGLSEKYFCICFDSKDKQFTMASTINISSCKTSNDETVLVYKIYNGTIERHKTEHGLCSTLTCTKPDVLAEVLCTADSGIKGLCEDGMRSNPGQYWGLPQNQSFKNCWNQNKLLLNSSACQYFAQNLTSPAWTNVFREEIEMEQTLGERKEIPKLCLSAIISKSDTGEYVLNQQRRNCSATLEWFVCKNDSTRIDNKSNEYEETASNHGPLIGGSIGAVIVLLIVVSVIVCKVRRIAPFKHTTSAKTTNVVFTKSVNGEETTLEVQTPQHVNQSDGLVYQAKEKNNKRNDSYAQVQKVKSTEDTYTESGNGEYDHLHNIGGRKPNSNENTYDSNAGVRNRNDPDYDTATSCTRVDRDNTYDHSFTNLKTCSEYDVSESRIQIARTKYDAYDQAC